MTDDLEPPLPPPEPAPAPEPERPAWLTALRLRAIIAASTACLFIGHSAPGTYIGPTFLGWIGWTFVMGVWAFRQLRHARRESVKGFRRRVWRLPALALVVAVLTLGEAPMRLRFLLSFGAANELAEELMKLPVGTQSTEPRSMGLYTVGGFKRFPGGVTLCVSGTGLISWGCFWYLGDGSGQEDQHRILWKHWYF